MMRRIRNSLCRDVVPSRNASAYYRRSSGTVGLLRVVISLPMFNTMRPPLAISAALTAGHIRAGRGEQLKGFLGRSIGGGDAAQAEHGTRKDGRDFAAACFKSQAGVVGRAGHAGTRLAGDLFPAYIPGGKARSHFLTLRAWGGCLQ